MKKEIETRLWIFKALYAVFSGQRLDFAIETMPKMSINDSSLARMIVMTVIRRNGELTSIIKRFTKNKNPKNKVRLLLKIGIAQLLFLKVPEYAAIDTTVELAKVLRLQAYVPLINAILRACQKEQSIIKTSPIDNIPHWLQELIIKDFSKEKLKQIAVSILSTPTMYISVKSEPQKWAEKLKGRVVFNNTIAIDSQKVSSIEGYEDGEWWVQDFSAAIPASLFSGSLEGKKVADFCAAPGGKTAQLVSMGAEVTAFDISEKRIEIMKQNFIRLNINPVIVNSDASEYLQSNPQEFDSILLDAPCSAIGTVRRNPDILLKDSYTPPIEEQEKLLETAFQALKPKGELVYSVCSFISEEGINQVKKLLSKHKNATLVPAKLPSEICVSGNMLITPDFMPETGGVDGFFAAIIKKN